ncbi:MAG: sigma-70 family RNA polymerase sigma factor [Alphaproteobacteria bacterium]
MELPDHSLEQLMHAAQTGDRKAYGRLLHEISPLIRSFLRRRLGPRADNEDVLQDVLLAIHKASHTYNTNRPFKAWMFAIADYKVKDYLRQHYRKVRGRQVDFAEIENFLIDPVTFEPTAAELLNDALSLLPDKQQKIVRLMKIEGYTATEVAQQMDMSESAVKVSAHRAYKVL